MYPRIILNFWSPCLHHPSVDMMEVHDAEDGTQDFVHTGQALSKLTTTAA